MIYILVINKTSDSDDIVQNGPSDMKIGMFIQSATVDLKICTDMEEEGIPLCSKYIITLDLLLLSKPAKTRALLNASFTNVALENFKKKDGSSTFDLGVQYVKICYRDYGVYPIVEITDNSTPISYLPFSLYDGRSYACFSL